MNHPARDKPADAELASVTCGACSNCGLLFAPWQMLGCERCGGHGSVIESRQLPASGLLRTWATVYVNRGAVPPTPFTVIELELDSGPTIRALLESGGGALVPGARVAGFAGNADGAVAEPLRFSLVESVESGT